MKQNESDNPFDNIFFWLGLATIDFSFIFEESPRNNKDTTTTKYHSNSFTTTDKEEYN